MNTQIGYCPTTKLPILQEYIQNEDKWLCLHRDTREEEVKEIEAFQKNIYLSFQLKYPHIEATKEVILEAYDQVTNKHLKGLQEVLDLMQDYILSQNLQEEVQE